MYTQLDTQCNPIDALTEVTFESGLSDKNMFDTHTQLSQNKEKTIRHSSQLSQMKKRKQGLLVEIKWLAQDIVKLITEVKMRPCLWNRLCKEKNNLNSRNNGWAAVAATFQKNQITAKDCIAKWQSLRTVQRDLVRRNKETSWRFFEQMSFVLFAGNSSIENGLVIDFFMYAYFYTLMA